MKKFSLQRAACPQGYGCALPRASHKGASGALFGVFLMHLLTACQTVTVAPAPSAVTAISPQEDRLRGTVNALIARAAEDGWSPKEGESLADILLHGRNGEGESVDAVDAYLARAASTGSSAQAQLEADATGARHAAARLGDELAAILSLGAFTQQSLAEDLRLVERAIINLKRGEALFSAASVRINALATPGATLPPAPAAWELELLRAEIKRLAEEIDRLADRVMQLQVAPN